MPGPIKCLPATLETPEGSLVLVVEDIGRGVTITWTRSPPWRLGSRERPGDALVKLTGRSGGFLLSRVFVVDPRELGELMALVAERNRG